MHSFKWSLDINNIQKFNKKLVFPRGLEAARWRVQMFAGKPHWCHRIVKVSASGFPLYTVRMETLVIQLIALLYH